MDLLSDLTEPQRRAVTHVDGPLLVLAGAGSGKTRVITRRVAHLIGQGVPPRRVLAITFTNKAAGEMAGRIDALGVPRGSTVGTFHALCVRLLREFADAAGVGRDFTIYDRDDQLRCVKEVAKRLEVPSDRFPPAMVHALISRAKNALSDPAGYKRHARDDFARTVAAVYAAYDKALAANNALDFDDLLVRTAHLLRDHEDIRAALGERYRYVLIDEYQDTNRAQYFIAHGIARDHENICATGDPDQSIYAWRGADINNILSFESDHPGALVVRLEHNYRSVQPILSAAGRLIAHNRRRKHKELLATRPGGAEVQVIRVTDEHAEADRVARIVKQARRDGRSCREIAVFYRVNALSRVLEAALRREGIAYQIARGVEFYNRKEIKDVLAYLRLMVNPRDDVSCGRIINVPPRGIGAATAGRLAAAAGERGISLLAACGEPAEAGLAAGAAAKVAAFAELIAEVTAEAPGSVRGAIELVIARTGLEAALRDADEDGDAALGNVAELVNSAAEFDQTAGGSLVDFLQQVSLVSDVDIVDAAAGAVTLMTLHAAKGLEFPVVVIVGCEEGLLPMQRADDDPVDVEEERRLAFVGMTRARDLLYLTGARYRMVRGRTERRVESPFLKEIGREGVRRTDESQAQAERPRPMSVAEYNRSACRRGESFHEEADLRAEIEAMEQADLVPPEFAAVRPGRRVYHQKFGHGQVLRVSYDGQFTRAFIRFDRGGQKTIVLEYAHLEPL